MSRLRIVIDTNVLISALLNPAGWEAQLVELIAYRVFQLFVSVEVLAEYQGVMNRAKFSHIDPKRMSRLLSVVGQEATLVTPVERLSISGDEEDNRFYECADVAQVAYIVTGNLKHFYRSYKTTKITTARCFRRKSKNGASPTTGELGQKGPTGPCPASSPENLLVDAL